LRSDPAKAAQVSIAEQDTSDAPREADSNPENVSIDMSDEVVNPSENVNVNLAAFLYVIRASEHVFPRDVDDCYDIFYGGSRFNDFSDHPVLTGEKKGIPLADHICAASGLGPGCVSTAAGAYQIIKPTWQKVREIAPRLNDFSPASQDEAARRLLEECGALPLIEMGDIAGAVAKASKLWASLPGSTAQQNPRKLAYVADRFAEGLEIYG
jgi:lysozyme